MASNLLTSTSQAKFKASAVLLPMFVVLAMLLAACGGSAGTTANQTGGQKSVLVIGAHVGNNFVKTLSPFNPQVNEGILGIVYEPLYFVNQIDGKQTPLLATSYQWNATFTQLTFTTRQNVKWNDGQPFSADDVAFTFNLLKTAKLDRLGIWTYLKSVQATDANTVVMTFQDAYPPLFWYVAGQTWIVPKHIFANVSDLTTFANDPPVGTGPYKLAKFSGEMIVYDKNPDYWQANQVKVDELRLPAVKDNQTLELKLAAGDIDWGSFYDPNLQSSFISKDPAHNHYWMPPYAAFGLYMNLDMYPLNQVAVRQAINVALDRQQLATQAEGGFVDPGSQTGLILPNQKDYLDPAYVNQSKLPDVAKATQLLQSAGFTKGSDGIFVDKNGKRLSFKLNVPTGWTDWETMTQVIKQNLKTIGIDIQINDIDQSVWGLQRDKGTYEMTLAGFFSGPSPFYQFNTHLNSANDAPNGQNFEHWKNPQTDQLLKQFASTSDPTAQKDAIQKLEKIFVEQVPLIPLVNAGNWYEYSSKHFTGWPEANNQYALGAFWESPDNLMVVTHLTPVS